MKRLTNNNVIANIWEKINKKGVIMGGLVVLLFVAGYLNYEMNNQQPKTPSGSPTPSGQSSSTNDDGKTVGSFFTSFKDERNQTRILEIAHLDSVINNAQSSQASIDEAQSQKLVITANMEKEVTIEGMLKAKGFPDAVVTLHPESVNVVIGQKSLTESEVAQIWELVKRETKEKTENIKIIPIT